MKAIANLALCPPNVDVFIDQDIGSTFEHLCRKCDQLPDSVVDVCLRTLSNLVMEFNEYSMEIFSTCLIPILEILKQKNRKDPIMLMLSFDILGALCRTEENARMFDELRGYAIVIEHLRTSAFEENMNNFGLKLLIRQARMLAGSCPKMMAEGETSKSSEVG